MYLKYYGFFVSMTVQGVFAVFMEYWCNQVTSLPYRTKTCAELVCAIHARFLEQIYNGNKNQNWEIELCNLNLAKAIAH